MKCQSYFIFLVLLSLARPAWTGDEGSSLLNGSIYSLDGDRVLFQWKMLTLDQGQTPWKTWYYDPAGREVAHDQLTWKDGKMV